MEKVIQRKWGEFKNDRERPYKVCENLRATNRPQTQKEREYLKSSIIQDGIVRDPLCVWKETGKLIDGYNRDDILQECSWIEYPEIRYFSFDSEENAKAWMIRKQLGQRNLNEWDKYKLNYDLLELQGIIEANAKKRMQNLRWNDNTENIDSVFSEETTNRRFILSEKLGWSTSKVDNYRKVHNHGTEEEIKALEAGEIGVSRILDNIQKRKRHKSGQPEIIEPENETHIPRKEDVWNALLDRFAEFFNFNYDEVKERYEESGENLYHLFKQVEEKEFMNDQGEIISVSFTWK